MGGLFFGGLEEIRTPDPRNANAMRSQLRYEPLFYGGCVKNYTAGVCVCQEVLWVFGDITRT